MSINISIPVPHAPPHAPHESLKISDLNSNTRQNWWGGGGPMLKAAVTLYISADRPILPPGYVKVVPPHNLAILFDVFKALWLPFAM